ncbi:MAG: hypothetical protein L7V30_04340 [Gammaproteobacteria bacterium]|nr:hypothetical protein [Gammaproteobacteria bacterium]
MIQTVSAKTFHHDLDAGLFYHLQDGRFFPTKWLAIDHGYNIGLSNLDITAKLRCCLHKNLSFDYYDWTVEPTESWDEVLKERLLWFRDNYEWLCLSYSGGADSQLILDTALKHKIKLDEIAIITTSLEGLGRDFNDYLSWELKKVALPRLESTDLSLIGNPLISIWQVDDWDLMAEAYSPDYIINHSSRTYEKYSTSQGAVALQASKKGGVILRGATHPTVLYDSSRDKFYTEIWDTDNFICGHQHEDKLAFFTSPEAPWVHAKQLHIMKNYLRKHKLFSFTEARQTKYRKIFQTLLRTNILNKKSPFFDKLHRTPLKLSPKALTFAKQMHKIYPELFKDLLGVNNTLHHGIPLYRHPEGILMGRYYLE